MLTVHVIEAKQLRSEHCWNCNTYVKLSLHPDEVKRTRCRTDVILDSNNPVFDEKFSFELLPEDLKKRLLISVWSRDYGEGKSEFLGCMSFGLEHIVKKNQNIQNWYHLLAEDVGKRKHLKASAPETPVEMEDKENKRSRDILWMDTHNITIKRGASGFGFTVTGSSPVQVYEIESNSTAELAGLRHGDYITHVNGINVTEMSTQTVAKLVRHSHKHLILEVERHWQESQFRVINQFLNQPPKKRKFLQPPLKKRKVNEANAHNTSLNSVASTSTIGAGHHTRTNSGTLKRIKNKFMKGEGKPKVILQNFI
ncbi:DgyrCDS4464 [Dimorphilus gyrociliatus]|nr:DgyrCDS4464 [Dimorphilus gyrociliatus]